MNSRTFQVAGVLIDRVDTPEKVVALTFDDGPSAGDVEPILQALDDAGVPATFYVIGQEADPGALRRLVSAGHDLGNHTWDHRRLVGVTPGVVASEVERTDEVIRDAGFSGVVTFRPPYSKKLLVEPWWMAQHERVTVMWDVEVDEFSDAPTAQDLADQAAEAVRPGSIILLHPWYGRVRTQEAIGPLVHRLQASGYRFVTVGELLSSRA